MKRILMVSILLCLIGAGCQSSNARTDLTGVEKWPEYHEQPQKIMVIAKQFNLPDIPLLENYFAKILTDNTTALAASSSKLFPPGRQYTTEDVNGQLTADGYQAVLAVLYENEGVKTSHVNEQTQTTGYTNVIGDTVYYNETTTTTPGYDIHRPYMNLTLLLLQVPSTKIVWKATARVNGNGDAARADLINSLVYAAIDRLTKDGILVLKNKRRQ